MYRYRIVFPAVPGQQLEQAKTAMVESEEPYVIGATIEHDGKLWQVTQLPLEAQDLGDYADIRVWPADAQAPA